MSNNELPPNVTPIRPPPSLDTEKHDPVGFAKLHGREYTTPSAAVEDAIRLHGFNEAVVGAGLIELRIVAEFSEDWAMFHNIQAAHVRPAPPEGEISATSAKAGESAGPSAASESAHVRVFKAIADATPELKYLDVLMASTVSEIETLDQELADTTDEELAVLVSGDHDEKSRLAHQYDCLKSWNIVDRLKEES